MIKYDVFDDYGDAGSQCRSTGMTRREYWDDRRKGYLEDTTLLQYLQVNYVPK
ncbi:hypothetical protein [Wolbachia endosymbiont of Tettigetta isshikii]|uniref:hypothetical protein n=1 Tax=Wolbachia endosymbiont of Tettigetta isshikii TaxID=3239093 RepID=UPI003980824C